MVADRFKLDPIAVLKANRVDWSIRLAAFYFVVEKESEAQERAASKQSSQTRQHRWRR